MEQQQFLELDDFDLAFEDLHWQSDYNGYECGYPEIDIVGCYWDPAGDRYFYLDMETLDVLESWIGEE